MTKDRKRALRLQLLAATALVGMGAAGTVHAQDASFEIYGFAQADYVQDFKRVDPDWDDTLRPSRIPTAEGQFGDDGQSVISVKQTRFGVRARQPIAGNDLLVRFEFDLFGVGGDAGQTTFRLRHAYGEWGPILAGQTHSLFMDIDTFPNTVDYWGPNGMVFLRSPQVRLQHTMGPNYFAAAIEKPSNDIDPGNIRLVAPELGASIRGDEELPDFTAQWRYTGGWGHVQLAGILRRVGFETVGAPNGSPKGSETGWGINATSNVKVGAKDVLHLAVVYGEGIASYMNDGGVDLAPEASPVVNPIPPGGSAGLSPEVVPLFGLVIYYDHYWNDQWSSSIGYSRTQVDNTNFQADNAFQTGHYASANLLYTPSPKILMGGELLWGEREDKNGATGEDVRLQLTFKYSFSSNDFK